MPFSFEHPQVFPSKVDRRALSMVEVLVALAIVFVLVLLGGASFSVAGKRSREVACLGNLKQVAAALLAYTVENNGKFPRSVFRDPSILPPHYPNVFWSDLLIRHHYVATKELFFCPEQKERAPNLFLAYSGYGVNRYGLMPNEADPAGYQPARMVQLKYPSRVAMLAETEVPSQEYDGWYEFYPRYASLTRPDDRELSIYPRHGARAAVAYADGHVTMTHVRKDFYGKTSNTRDFPWACDVYTIRNFSYEPK